MADHPATGKLERSGGPASGSPDAANPLDPAELRSGAEQRAQALEFARQPPLSSEETSRLVHELRVHQIELEMQNEELRRVQVELRKAKERYFDLYDLAPVGYCTVSEKGLILEANLTAATLLGVARRELVKQPFSRFVCAEDGDTYYLYRRQLMESGQPQACELRMSGSGGRPFWARLEAMLVRDEAATLLCRIVLSDISERKAADETLRASEERFKSIFQGSPDGILLADPVTRKFKFCNETICRMTGYSQAELSTMAVQDFHPPADLPAVVDAFEKQFRREHEVVRNVPVLCKDGSLLFADVNSVLISLGGITYLAGFFRDVTERKQAEDERTRLFAAIEQAAESIVITDVAGTILYTNPAFEKVTGYSWQEAAGQNPRLLKSGHHDPAFYRQLWETLLRGEVWHGRLINKRKDGTLCEEDATISPVRDAAGRIANFVAVKHDVTEQVALEAQLRQAQKMEAIGTLAGGVAHEINNPIFGIKNYAQLMADNLPPDSELQRFAAGIMQQTDRVSNIVRNLLAFARLDKQGRSLTSLDDIIQSALLLTQAVIRHDQILLTVEVPPGLPPLECHSQQLEQVLLNLLTNARDALNEKYDGYHEDKVIQLRAGLFEQDGQPWARVTVEDHGPGIPARVRERMFDPFFTTKTAGKGTGLGLSISHGIMQEHGGRLRVETQPGHFTRMHMELPIQRPEGQNAGVLKE